jgi:hypothetical protein
MTENEIRVHAHGHYYGEPRVTWSWTPEEAVRPGAAVYYATYGHLKIGDLDLSIESADMEAIANLLLTEVANRRREIARAREADRAVA